LLGPIIKQINNIFEKPVFIVLRDNSVSIQEVSDTVSRNQLSQKLKLIGDALEGNQHDVAFTDLSGEDNQPVKFQVPTSDLQGALRNITTP
jgi:hypothetical protein